MEAVVDSGQVLLDELATLEVERAAVEALIVARMVEFADLRRREADAQANPIVRELEASFAADELGLVLHQPTGTVQGRLAEARRVRGLLPTTWSAFRAGVIDGYRVKLIAAAAAKLSDNHGLIHLDHDVVAYASTHTTAQLRAWLNRFVTASEPDNANQRAADELLRRSVWVQHGDDGLSFLQALIPTVDAERIDKLLTAEAAKLSRRGGTLEQRRADVFVDHLLTRGKQHAGSGAKAGTVVIGVTVPVTTLAGVDNAPGVSFDGQFALPADLIRDLAAEPGTLFHRIITDPLGHVLDVTETGRFASTQLSTALAIRDGTCGFPTCSRPAFECDNDHVEPHPRGPTTGRNLRSLCKRHHRMKTHRVLTTSIDEHGHHWHLPTGRTITSEVRTMPTEHAT